ncbi:hypothetical protein DXG01_002156 [Tephrocybe rancida]|nr:hypothetical protein DXG01_002156 [Tephrocybe rancida]
MPDNLLVILDSADLNDVVYGGGPDNGTWITEKSSRSFGGSSAWSSQVGESPATSGSVHVTFTGNTIAFYGSTPPPELSQDMAVTIDKSDTWRTSFPANQAGSYSQWWQSPLLDDGTHTIQLDGLTQMSLDFMAVTVSSTSLKAGQQIIVDDADPALQYAGNWNISTVPFINPGQDKTTTAPFHNTTHQSNTTGDSVEFHFTGSNVSVYGIMSWANIGSITTRYALDSKETTRTYRIQSNSPDPLDGFENNFLLFSAGHLDDGPHNLSIQVTDCQNVALILDYVVYTSSPTTISAFREVSSSISALTPTTSHPAPSRLIVHSPVSSFPPQITFSTSNVNPVVTLESTSVGTSTLSPAPSQQDSTTAGAAPTGPVATSSSLRKGEIVAAVLGSLAIVIIIIAAIVYWKWRRSKPHGFTQLNAFVSRPRPISPVTPFTLVRPTPHSAAAEPFGEKLGMAMSLVSPLSRYESVEKFAALHRRSGSGDSKEEGGSRESYYTVAASSTITIGGKPPSYTL